MCLFATQIKERDLLIDVNESSVNAAFRNSVVIRILLFLAQGSFIFIKFLF